MKQTIIYIFFLSLSLLYSHDAQLLAQAHTTSINQFLTPSDTLNHRRLNFWVGTQSIAYAGSLIGLNEYWYKKYERESFHLFNDHKEWLQMDKVGHIFSTYHQTAYIYKAYRWSGLSDEKSSLISASTALLFQSSIEILDGFSSKWGFSMPDMIANIGGAGLFLFQQHYFDKQLINMKLSSRVINYDASTIVSDNGLATSSIDARARDLFGSSRMERLLKDYNAQIYWLSFDINSISGSNSNWPQWLNIALGYGGSHMLGGFKNTWVENGHQFTVKDYDRYAQFYLGFDLQVERIATKSPLLKSVQYLLRSFKIPGPALELNTKGEFTFHILR